MADIVQNGSTPLIQTGWSQQLSFQQFDPSQGTLSSVGLGIVGDVAGSVAIGNHDSLDATISGNLTATETAAAGGVVSVSTRDSAAIGPTTVASGTALTLWNLAADSAPALSGATSNLGAFVGGGQVPVTVSAQAGVHLTGTANEFIVATASADAGVLLDYTYVPPRDSSGDGLVGLMNGGVGNFNDNYPANSVRGATQTFVLRDRVTGWTDTIAPTRFDPSLGTLAGIEIALRTDLHTTLSIENVGAGDAAYHLTTEDKTSVGRPGGTGPITADTTASAGGMLGGFDGSLDYAGSSGTITTAAGIGFGQVADSLPILTDAADLAALTGTGTGLLPVTNIDSSTFDGPGNVRANFVSTSGAEVDVTYLYVPVSADTSCFAEGTRIATEAGEVAVERLAVGDVVRTHFSGRARVAWIGHRRVDCARHPDPASVRPLRVRAGAFGPGLPARDLFLSPDHAVFLEDVLIPVKHLRDGGAVAQVPAQTVTYYHVELERHDVIFAEGLPAESYLETGQRSAFANGGRTIQAHPDFAARVREAEACAPFAVAGPVVAAARARLGSDRQVMAVV